VLVLPLFGPLVLSGSGRCSLVKHVSTLTPVVRTPTKKLDSKTSYGKKIIKKEFRKI